MEEIIKATINQQEAGMYFNGVKIANAKDLDKLELMLNLNNFLQESEYEENIKILVKKNK